MPVTAAARGGLLLTLGGLGDRFGRAKTLRVGLVIFIAAALAAAYSQNSEQVIAARAVMGIGGALIMPSTLSIITDVFRGPERAKAIAIWAAVAGVGVGIGPLIGGLLLDNFWWGSVFLVNVPVAGLALVLGIRLVPDSKDPEPKPLDIPGAVLSTGAIAGLVYAIIEAPALGWGSVEVIGAFVGAALLGAAFVAREKTTDHPLLDFDFFKRPRFSLGALAISVAFFALLGMVFGLSQYLQFVKGYSPLEAGVRLLPIAAGIAVGARGSERLVGKLGTTIVVAGALTLLAGTIAAINFFDAQTPYWAIGTGVFFVAMSMGSIMAPSTEAVMGSVPRAHAGVGSAMNDVTRMVGGALGVAVIGSILNSLYSDRMAAAVAGLPERAADVASDSVGGAMQIAASLPGASGEALRTAAGSAYTDSFGLAVLAGTGLAALGAVAVARLMPARGVAIEGDAESEPDRPAPPGPSKTPGGVEVGEAAI